MRLLGIFGLSHGIHEWMQLYSLIEGDHLPFQAIFLAKFAALVVFVASYLFLLWFGRSLIRGISEKRVWRVIRAIPVILSCACYR